MNLTLSKYTHFFKTCDNAFLLYNSEKNCFVKVSKTLFDYILALSEGQSPPHIEKEKIDVLLRHKIIVPENEKDLFYNKIKLMNSLDRFSYDKLTLNIIPTTCCNFSCPYCFEKEKTNHTITDQTIDDLIVFINKNSAKKMNLMWYGGEPLLAFEKIKKILISLHNNVNIPIAEHSMVTNGYLFDEKVCNFFKNYPLKNIQITIDGEEHEHNSKRFTRSDHFTFDKIMKNIDTILNELPDTHVYLRINIDEKNKDSFHKLHKKLSLRWQGKAFSMYPGFIRIEDDKEAKMIAPSILGKSKRNFFFDLENQGVEVNFYPRHTEKACSAVRMNTFIVGPEGEFYKCWNDVSDRKKIIGYINRPNLENSNLLTRYIIDGSMFDDIECKDCFFFPICGGGCPQYRLKNKYENGTYDLCAVRNDKRDDKQYLTSCLEKHYNKIKNKTQTIEI